MHAGGSGWQYDAREPCSESGDRITSSQASCSVTSLLSILLLSLHIAEDIVLLTESRETAGTLFLERPRIGDRGRAQIFR